MNSMNKIPSIADARSRCDEAETALAHSRGELIAMVRDNVARLPAEIRRACDRLDDAEAFAAEARDAVAVARLNETSDPVTYSEKAHHARVSALVAVHIMGAELVPGFSDVYQWRIRGVDGKIREVPNFTGDAGAIARAEALLADGLRDKYASELLRIATGGASVDGWSDVWAVACANPYLRSLALLTTVHVVPTDEPPRV